MYLVHRTVHGVVTASPHRFPSISTPCTLPSSRRLNGVCSCNLAGRCPPGILDLSAEFRCQFNGVPLSAGRGLIGALIKHGLAATTKEEK
jgi:hypothetical protein